MRGITRRPTPMREGRAVSQHGATPMKFFARIFARRPSNLTTALERQRLQRTMPGQTGAVAAARLGHSFG